MDFGALNLQPLMPTRVSQDIGYSRLPHFEQLVLVPPSLHLITAIVAASGQQWLHDTPEMILDIHRAQTQTPFGPRQRL